MAHLKSLLIGIFVYCCMMSGTVKSCSRGSSKGEDSSSKGATPPPPTVTPGCCNNLLTRLRQDALIADGTQHAMCVYYRDSGCLACKRPSMSSQCCTVASSIHDDTLPSGPVPRGEYLMSEVTKHSMLNVEWIKLLPKKSDGTGYWPYEVPAENGRSYMSINAGCISLASVTVDTCEVESKNAEDCWSQTLLVLQGGTMLYEGGFYSGILQVV
ncbi:uncharacterized protein LOC144433832 [Glandiceps talaboti]